MNNPTAIFLIGMPAVGKSSLIQQNGWDTDPNTYIHSTDNIVTEIANRDGITYDEFFASGRFGREVIPVLHARLADAIRSGKNIIVDMVNETKAKRALTQLPDHYQKEAWIIGHKPWYRKDKRFLKKIKHAVAQRHKATGKSVPQFVLDNMFKSYEVPSMDEEGFTAMRIIEPLNPLVT
jgi:predicted kinase